ncbi:HTH-type transcriptional activator HxlR [Fundidesulfovibrio magnetotacticus]|uniref:HTH-type transcriptional activator HxlR n=1 Tax=Fundidesulfovibrio magnetotacticus TaxID=2730080 RepID=A0A6V8LJE2_9BACT|nr:helix-turn-helix domain-containing protein [Fundidesulfovibrio magnetotacticus]GFK92843.1 HTH-type transcriptional activator HxlR [Fundidesulfovibrio magnetotacticus]
MKTAIAPCAVKELGDKRYRCFFELTLLVMGGKWKPIVIYHLGRAGVMRFSELRRSMAGVTERMLARQLRELEADGIVTRTVFREVPPRVEYALTDLGRGLVPILEELRDWGAAYEQAMDAEGRFRGPGYENPVPGLRSAV